MKELMQQAMRGSARALAKLISLVENDAEGSQAMMKELYSRTGRARIIGVTGPPGVGKSTLIAQLADRFAQENRSVAILAVDPSSELSGGALLGDRVRMVNLEHDDRIFIRSVSSRGCMGGVSRATENIVRVMDAVGRDPIIIETIGVGQDECDVTWIAETSILVLAPGLGDEIQFLKAGITEMADVFVINKSDQPGSKRYFYVLNEYNDLYAGITEWLPPIVETAALHNRGIDTLHTVVNEHLALVATHKDVSGRRNDRLREEIMRKIENTVRKDLTNFLEQECDMELVIQNIVNGSDDPYSAADRILKQFYRKLHCRFVS